MAGRTPLKSFCIVSKKQTCFSSFDFEVNLLHTKFGALSVFRFKTSTFWILQRWLRKELLLTRIFTLAWKFCKYAKQRSGWHTILKALIKVAYYPHRVEKQSLSYYWTRKSPRKELVLPKEQLNKYLFRLFAVVYLNSQVTVSTTWRQNVVVVKLLKQANRDGPFLEITQERADMHAFSNLELTMWW